MNIVWTLAVIISVAVLAVKNPDAVATLFIDGAGKGIRCALELAAVYCLWLGVTEVAERCSLVQGLARLFGGVNRFLYGSLDEQASGYISLNLASNLLGVGNAATPSAISALKITEKGTRLSRTGAMLFVVNASGVQLVPTTVIGLRASCGSASPSDILLPTLICTAVTSVIGVAAVFVAYGAPKAREKRSAPIKGVKSEYNTV